MDRATDIKATLTAFYNTEQNKKYIYFGALGLWTLTLIFCFSLISLFLSTKSEASFYIMLIFSQPLIFGATYLKDHCFLAVPRKDFGFMSSGIAVETMDEPYLRTNEML